MADSAPSNPLREQVLALAGLCQAVSLVDSIARTGNAEPAPFEACIQSLFSFSATSTAEAYGGVDKLELGLRSLNDLLSGERSQSDRELARYLIGATHLQRQLEKQPEVAAIIRSRLEHSSRGVKINGINISEELFTENYDKLPEISKQGLSLSYLDSGDEIYDLFLLDNFDLENYVDLVELVSDDNLLLEFSTGKNFLVGNSSKVIEDIENNIKNKSVILFIFKFFILKKRLTKTSQPFQFI